MNFGELIVDLEHLNIGDATLHLGQGVEILVRWRRHQCSCPHVSRLLSLLRIHAFSLEIIPDQFSFELGLMAHVSLNFHL